MSLTIEDLEARGIYDRSDQLQYLESEYELSHPEPDIYGYSVPSVYDQIYEKSMSETESSHEWHMKTE